MTRSTILGNGRTVTVLGWLGLLILTVVGMAALERQRLFSELQTKAEILHRLASQRADQHDAHLTSLSALATAGEAERRDLFLDVAATIMRFYPRIVAIDLVPLDRLGRYVTTRPGLSNELADIIVADARSSDGALVLRADLEAEGRYLVIKRSPNTDEARFGLALTVDAPELLATDDAFWLRPSMKRALYLPDGTVLFRTRAETAAMQFRKALGSTSQPLILEAGIAPRLADLLPAGRLLAVLAVMTGLYLLAILGLRQLTRARRAERLARLSADDARLAHASRVNALGEMASGMAHELTQPLTAILSQAQAGRRLAKLGDIEGSEAGFGRIVEQAKRAAVILDRLRDWTRPQSGRIEPVPINEAVGNVEALLRRDIEAGHVTLSTDLSATRNITLQLDRIALEQIVFNLLRNAVEAADESADRWVRVASEATGTGIVVEVSDSGPGVPEHIRERVFEPFVTGKKEGTGLGLALCQRLAERLGGDLSLAEDRAETVFRLWLPVPDVENREAAE
ncbi:ATP-binding protein [Sedimentitalea sp. JM2-8]|uniref:histidine kinase n=1 Tax=Sedimentitalea xiamensis TaxID=3050037 RepID=A0ABT7FL06_9RHOB|nr:ATP-binding protein [Sedimentitalea xiamensis]MDK3075834.1 ATP-binding protein [Sedimentitalea xiamensis]